MITQDEIELVHDAISDAVILDKLEVTFRAGLEPMDIVIDVKSEKSRVSRICSSILRIHEKSRGREMLWELQCAVNAIKKVDTTDNL